MFSTPFRCFIDKLICQYLIGNCKVIFIFRSAKQKIDLSVNENEINPCSANVNGLTDTISRQMLYNYFSKFGHVEDIIWNRFQRRENYSKWAIVTFSDAQSAQSVIHEQNHAIQNRWISVIPSRKKMGMFSLIFIAIQSLTIVVIKLP